MDAPQAVRLWESSAGLKLLFRGDLGRIHVVESTATLDGIWEVIGRGDGEGLDRDSTIPIPAPRERTRFYRVQAK